jgi:hypothetical protein
MVELCQSRVRSFEDFFLNKINFFQVNILSLDERTLMKEASEMNLHKFRTIIKAVRIELLLELI